jgi:hypothetical protein
VAVRDTARHADAAAAILLSEFIFDLAHTIVEAM